MIFQFLAQLKGLRDDPIPPFTGTSGGIGFAAVFQMVLALAVVLILVKWLVPKYVSKLGKKTNLPVGSELKVEEAATVSGGQLLLVTARGRTILVGAGANGFSTLADLSEEVELPAKQPDGDFDKVLERLKKLQG